MKPIDLATIVLGLAAIALGVFVPPMAPYAVPTGIGLIVSGLPQVSALLTAAQRRIVATTPATTGADMPGKVLPKVIVIDQPDTSRKDPQ